MYIGRLAGIDLKLNNLFLVLIICMGLLGMLVDSLLIFLVVIVHEIGHVIVAKKLNYHVESIELLPIGGVAKIYEGDYNKSSDEWFIALSGPVNNILFIIVLLFFPQSDRLIKYNLTLLIFNLLPAFPLDGGRLLKAKLAKDRPMIEAKKLASIIGVIIGLTILAMAYFYYYINVDYLYLSILGFFLIISAIKEYKAAKFLPLRMGIVKEDNKIDILEGKILICSLRVKINQIIKHLETDRGILICIIDEKGEVVDLITDKRILQIYNQGLGNLSLQQLLLEY
ncbi:stage IV sporulation protein FB [Anaerobranca californiensis DSM 14826]|jgi:stage IV sporulation protein FB|uniref:Stage IV sporulation protein FB n=1 Tax=Anaerobranca californiensis DSM 14826 TaxID=1120989 RepID=A0A1M6NI96_9FIRM|nr:M50 family metallopeptidase [Anaerobranca californiensis]SHJ95451.1 stage IV sporulation protein FB [Anaerobranca californiensis DSM 14826]